MKVKKLEKRSSFDRIVAAMLTAAYVAMFGGVVLKLVKSHKQLPVPPGYVDYGRDPETGSKISTEYDYTWYSKDAMINGFESWGVDHLLKNIVGPLDEFKLGPEDTIEKIAKEICLLRYGCIDGHEKWNKAQESAHILLNILNERCKEIPYFDMLNKEWTLKESEATGLYKLIDYNNRKLDLSAIANQDGVLEISNGSEKTICALRYIVEYMCNNNPADVAIKVIREDSKLQTELFNLRVEQYTKKKTLGL